MIRAASVSGRSDGHQDPVPRPAAAAAAIGPSSTRGLSAEHMIDEALRKLSPSVPSTEVEVGTTDTVAQGDRLRRIDDRASRHERLRDQRRRLRQLQNDEYQLAITPTPRASATPLSDYAFGFSFILLGLHYTGRIPLDTVLVASSICIGGGLQVLVGLLSWTHGQTFAFVSSLVYGAFFLAHACTWLLPSSCSQPNLGVQAVSSGVMGTFYFIWALVSFLIMLCTPAINLCLVIKFLTTTLSLMCLAGGMVKDNHTAIHTGGYLAIVAGATSFYLFVALLMNDIWKKHLLSMGQMTMLRHAATRGRSDLRKAPTL